MTPEQVLFALTRGRPVEVPLEDRPAVRAFLLERVALWTDAEPREAPVSPRTAEYIRDIGKLLQSWEG